MRLNDFGGNQVPSQPPIHSNLNTPWLDRKPSAEKPISSARPHGQLVFRQQRENDKDVATKRLRRYDVFGCGSIRRVFFRTYRPRTVSGKNKKRNSKKKKTWTCAGDKHSVTSTQTRKSGVWTGAAGIAVGPFPCTLHVCRGRKGQRGAGASVARAPKRLRRRRNRTIFGTMYKGDGNYRRRRRCCCYGRCVFGVFRRNPSRRTAYTNRKQCGKKRRLKPKRERRTWWDDRHARFTCSRMPCDLVVRDRDRDRFGQDPQTACSRVRREITQHVLAVIRHGASPYRYKRTIAVSVRCGVWRRLNRLRDAMAVLKERF